MPPWQCSCASSGRACRLWAAQHSQEEAGPLGALPLPWVLERAASQTADVTAFDHSGARPSGAQEQLRVLGRGGGLLMGQGGWGALLGGMRRVVAQYTSY